MKTRLAQAIAQDVSAHFADGVVLVDVTPITNPDFVLVAIAIAAAAALVIHLLAPGAVRALGRSLHGG